MKTAIKSISTILVGLIVWAFFIEPSLLLVKREEVSGWTGPPMKVVFFSDLHAGSPHINKKYIHKLVDKINKESPDLVLIGGDLVINGIFGGEELPLQDVIDLIKQIKSTYGIYAVLGNHEWWHGSKEIIDAFQRNGIPILQNQSVKLTLNNHFQFWLVGLDDAATGHSRPDLAFSKVDENLPRLVFTHDPAAFIDFKYDYFLAIAGHLHGGQINIPLFGTLFTPGDAPKTWSQGWVKGKNLFVSKGIGTSIFPIRFNAPPEFVVFDFINN
jgi:predicted MPP superfamily phosphohydrolase